MGTREIVRNIVTGFYVRKVLVVGKPVDIAGQSGILTAITATHAILKHFHFWCIRATDPDAAFPQEKPHLAALTCAE